MAQIFDRLQQDLILTEDTSILGEVTGWVLVPKWLNLELHGVIIGKLMLDEGSHTIVHGTVLGDIENNGGFLHILGTVTGTIITHCGKTEIELTAKVSSHLFEPDECPE